MGLLMYLFTKCSRKILEMNTCKNFEIYMKLQLNYDEIVLFKKCVSIETTLLDLSFWKLFCFNDELVDFTEESH